MTDSDTDEEHAHKHFYCLGRTRKEHKTVLMVCHREIHGWRARSTERALQHDYVSGEGIEEIISWIDFDLHRHTATADRQDIQVFLKNQPNSMSRLREHSFLCATSHDSDEAWVDKVLGHLERGW